MGNDAVVVIPTYDEKDNIVRLVDELDRLNLSLDILIVDDNSPDGTGRIAESIKKTKPNVSVIHRKRKEGIGPAYVEGFRRALNNKEYDYIIEMDADFSHNPEDIPRLLSAGRSSDVVVGSRYVKGGSVSGQWNIFRKAISRFGNLYAMFVTGLKVQDCTAGFKCYKRGALESLDLNKKFLNGYGFQVEILYRLKQKGFSICEIPIFFDERQKGSSKMSLHIVKEAFFSLTLIRFKNKSSKK